jgi:microcystin-dependent protein
MPISQNDALFSLIGTMYGGDGVNTFALPDFRGRAPIGQGSGPGLSNYTVGEIGGSETVTLTWSQMPQHAHVGVEESLGPAARRFRGRRDLRDQCGRLDEPTDGGRRREQRAAPEHGALSGGQLVHLSGRDLPVPGLGPGRLVAEPGRPEFARAAM